MLKNQPPVPPKPRLMSEGVGTLCRRIHHPEGEQIPIEVVLTCARGDRPPTADRFTYTTDEGERRTFERARK